MFRYDGCASVPCMLETHSSARKGYDAGEEFGYTSGSHA